VSVALWASEAWRRSATEWVDARLAEAGSERTGEAEQPHLRPWATVLRIPTARGPVWLKAAGRDTAFEAPLYELLLSVVPDRVLVPLAVDADRAWILLPDGGPPLGAQLKGAALMDALERILPVYGVLQRELAPHVGEILAAGVPDMRPAVMPARFDEALDAMRAYAGRTGPASDREAVARVAAVREPFTRWCEALAAAPAPLSLDHNDLHPGNILSGGGHTRFYDWGDSVVAHPFASMLVALGMTQRLVDEPDVEPLRDAYLEAFSDLAPHADLVATLELACRVGKVARALTWHRAIGAGGPDEVEPAWIRGPIESMISLLDDSYLGRT
jgi:hypothetical protein